jgi:hypothetical protein
MDLRIGKARVELVNGKDFNITSSKKFCITWQKYVPYGKV